MLRWLLVASFVLYCGGFDEVLILTQGRSGANFLGELLNKGHRVAYLHEPCRCMASRNSPLGPFTAEKCAALVTRFLSCTPLESELDAFTKDSQAMERSEDWVGEMRARSKYSGRSRRSLRDLFLPPCRASSRIVTETRLFAPSAPSSSSSFAVQDSSSEEEERIFALQALMARPSLAVVHLVRDARAVVAGRLSMHGLGACSRHNPPQCAVDLCQQMEEAYKGTQALSTAGRYRLLRFEDLIAAPTAYAAAVYQWLNWGNLPAEVHEWAAIAKKNYTAAVTTGIAATTATDTATAATAGIAATYAAANSSTAADSMPDLSDGEMESVIRRRSNGRSSGGSGFYGRKRNLPDSNSFLEGQRSSFSGGGGSVKGRSKFGRNREEGSIDSSASNGYDDPKGLLRAAKELYRTNTGWRSSSNNFNDNAARRRRLLRSSTSAARGDDDGASGMVGYRISSDALNGNNDDDYSRSSSSSSRSSHSSSFNENNNFPDLKFQKTELRAMSVEELRHEAQKLDTTSSTSSSTGGGLHHQKQNGKGLHSSDHRNHHHHNNYNMQRNRKNGHKMAASRRDGFEIGQQVESPVVYKWEHSLSTLTIAKTTAICKATLKRYHYPVEKFLAPAPTGASALPWVQARIAQQEAAAQRKADWQAAHLRGEPYVDADVTPSSSSSLPSPSTITSSSPNQPPTSLAAMLRPHGRRALLRTSANSTRVHGLRFGSNESSSTGSSPKSNSSSYSSDRTSSSSSMKRRLTTAWPASASETGKRQPRPRGNQGSSTTLGSQRGQEQKSLKPRLDLMLRADKEKRAELKQRKEADRAQHKQHKQHKQSNAGASKGDFTAWTPSEESLSSTQSNRAAWKKRRPFDRDAAKQNVFYNPA